MTRVRCPRHRTASASATVWRPFNSRTAPTVVPPRGVGRCCVPMVAGLIQFPVPDIVLRALFDSVHPSATRIAIVGQTGLLVELSSGDHFRGIAMESEGTRLMLMLWARSDQLAALMADVQRRVESCVWPPGSATLEWIGKRVGPLRGRHPPFRFA